MGTFHTTIEVARDPGGPFEAVEALVDSGATYTLLPRTMLERLDVQRRPRRTLVLADGSVQDLDMGLIWVRLHGEENPTLVAFGPDDAEPLLGAVTLEEFALGIDPLRRELIPVRGYLVGLTRQDGAP